MVLSHILLFSRNIRRHSSASKFTILITRAIVPCTWLSDSSNADLCISHLLSHNATRGRIQIIIISNHVHPCITRCSKFRIIYRRKHEYKGEILVCFLIFPFFFCQPTTMILHFLNILKCWNNGLFVSEWCYIWPSSDTTIHNILRILCPVVWCASIFAMGVPHIIFKVRFWRNSFSGFWLR